MPFGPAHASRAYWDVKPFLDDGTRLALALSCEEPASIVAFTKPIGLMQLPHVQNDLIQIGIDYDEGLEDVTLFHADTAKAIGKSDLADEYPERGMPYGGVYQLCWKP